MTTSNDTSLDQDELLHLALEALRRNDHGTALSHLKVGAQRFPDNANIAFLLGAENAQIGLFDRAEAEFTRAVTINPKLTMARFQLGLLQLTQARLDDAKATWAGLEELPAEHSLRLFKQGLEAMAEDRFADARTLIEKGIANNDFSVDLNNDMNNVLSNFPKDDAGSAPGAAEPSPEAAPAWFNAYQNTDQNH